MSASMRQAARFADAALRRVLEVIDRRRSISQLNGLLAAGLVDSVLSANRLAGADREVAVLRRVRLQAVGSPDEFAAAEVFGSYSRGRRLHAIACRMERGAGRWQVFCTGTLPQAAPSFIGHVLYQLDVNVRSATLLGIVGAGGIGFDLLSGAQILEFGLVTTILLMVFSTVLVVEALAVWLRHEVS